MFNGINAGVFSDTHNRADSYNRLGFAGVFQVEVQAILSTFRWLGYDLKPKNNITILTDSQAAI